MGCDGGTIPRRDELVRTKKKPEQKDKNAETVAKWKHCAISQDPLRKPIVACELGRLYNKEAVIEHILNKEKIASSPVANHITKLSDVKELNLTEKSDFKQKNSKGDEYVDFNNSRYICPVTGLDMNGKQKFHFNWKCGCVLSDRAIKEVKSETCHKCGQTQNDMVIINGSDEEIESLREKMTERRRLAKLEKKKKRSATATETSTTEKKIKIEHGEPSTSGIKMNGVRPNNSELMPPPATDLKFQVKEEKSYDKASSNGKDVSEKVIKNGVKVEKTSEKASSNVRDLPEKASKGYSIANDPNASAAYKSLFTSHKSAKNQVKAHWITHNPCYW